MPDSIRQTDMTGILLSWRNGDVAALGELIPLVYGELRKLARAHLRREAPHHSLQPTALVHEAFLRLAALDPTALENRTHFFALAAKLMRQVLVDQARGRKAKKRGGDFTIVAFDDAAHGMAPKSIDLLALDEALDAMGTFDPRQRDVVELRYFAGLTIAETATALEVSPATVERDWTIARAWLHRRLGKPRVKPATA